MKRQILLMNEYTVFTDGGSRNHGNVKGGHVLISDKSAYAYLITFNGKRIYSHTHGYYAKTNNQMELAGVIQALRYLLAAHANHCRIALVSDSRYVDNAVNKHWLDRWHRQDFKTKHGVRANTGLWKLLYILLQHYPYIEFIWTKGHTDGKSFCSRGNIFVDHLLNKTMDKMK